MSTLAKKIGLWSAVSIIIGTIIGSGVFMKPASMAAQLGSPVWLTLTWIIAGVFSLFGALIYAELGAMMPETGGIYVYFRRMFGDFTAYLYGWSAFSVINTASVAAIGFVCAQYADYFLQLPRFSPGVEQSVVWHLPFVGDLYPLQNAGVKSLAIVLVLLFTALNARSVKAGNAFQLVSTILKVAVIIALVAGIFFVGHGSVNHFTEAAAPKQGTALLNGIIAALTGAFFAYDGWINITFVAGEVKQPQRNIATSLFIGTGVCIVIYLLVNQAYLYALPVEKMAGSSLVASDAVAASLGNTSEAIIAAMIVLCTLGGLNGNIMASARVTYAMGKKRDFLLWSGKEHSRFQTPFNALWLHAGWVIMLIISGSFDMLADMMVFVSWTAYGLGAVGVFILRRKMRDADRPYKIWMHPIVTILFIVFTFFFLSVTVYNDVTNYIAGKQPVVNSLFGLVIVALGIPLFFYYRKRKMVAN